MWHTINLILVGIAQIRPIWNALAIARSVYVFIYGHKVSSAKEEYYMA